MVGDRQHFREQFKATTTEAETKITGPGKIMPNRRPGKPKAKGAKWSSAFYITLHCTMAY